MSQVIYKLGDDISTDIIYPGRYMATVLPTETQQFAFADIKTLNEKLNTKQFTPGSVITAGKNFGCGSSREQAVSTLKGYEIIIIARSFARIFLQNSINLGLQIITCPDIEANEGDELDVTEKEIINKTSGKSFRIEPMPKSRQAIIDAGGLIAYTRKRIMEKQSRRG
ncbi:MAG: 3-isopropylmalate dehydratase [Bacteroidetes bacterium]|nr:3-isopropylmalate dehydratase [Bacteroidota bacterium]